MIYQKKDLFTIFAIPEDQRTPIMNADRFPPAKITWKNEELTYLGVSNKTDLLSESSFKKDDEEVLRAFKNNMIKQFMYSNLDAELFEVLIMQSEDGSMYIAAIRTRRKA